MPEDDDCRSDPGDLFLTNRNGGCFGTSPVPSRRPSFVNTTPGRFLSQRQAAAGHFTQFQSCCRELAAARERRKRLESPSWLQASEPDTARSTTADYLSRTDTAGLSAREMELFRKRCRRTSEPSTSLPRRAPSPPCSLCEEDAKDVLLSRRMTTTPSTSPVYDQQRAAVPHAGPGVLLTHGRSRGVRPR